MNELFKVVVFFADNTLSGSHIYKGGELIATREPDFNKDSERWVYDGEKAAYCPCRGASTEDNALYESLFVRALKVAPISESKSKLKKMCYKGISTSDLENIRAQWEAIKEQ